jgi:hypothetical protein
VSFPHSGASDLDPAGPPEVHGQVARSGSDTPNQRAIWARRSDTYRHTVDSPFKAFLHGPVRKPVHERLIPLFSMSRKQIALRQFRPATKLSFACLHIW